MGELIDRLEAASKKLFDIEMDYRRNGHYENASRVMNKRAGVTLALSYAKEVKV